MTFSNFTSVFHDPTIHSINFYSSIDDRTGYNDFFSFRKKIGDFYDQQRKKFFKFHEHSVCNRRVHDIYIRWLFCWINFDSLINTRGCRMGMVVGFSKRASSFVVKRDRPSLPFTRTSEPAIEIIKSKKSRAYP